jgi:hypothetical protein
MWSSSICEPWVGIQKTLEKKNEERKKSSIQAVATSH